MSMSDYYYDRNKEIDEALAAGDEALRCLHEAWDHLNKARGWGIFDMLGGELITTFMKHNQLNQAERALTNARNALRNYSHEVSDVREAAGIDIQVGDLLSFADFFFDGLIVDWLVQSKIKQSRDQVAAAIDKVTDMQQRLIGMKITVGGNGGY